VSVSVSASFYQTAAGAPVQMRTTVTILGLTDCNDNGGIGFGVKATSAQPTNASEFGGHIYLQNNAAIDYNRTTEIDTYRPGDDIVDERYEVTCVTKKTLDANWAAGRYVFAFTQTGAGVIKGCSAAYHIR